MTKNMRSEQPKRLFAESTIPEVDESITATNDVDNFQIDQTTAIDILSPFADINDIYHWEGHHFREIGDTWKGYCPFHESSSGTSFWVTVNENDQYVWACPTCTDNKKKNVFYYQNRLFGNDRQPIGDEYKRCSEAILSRLNIENFQECLIKKTELDSKKAKNKLIKLSDNLLKIAEESYSFILEHFPDSDPTNDYFINLLAKQYTAYNKFELLAAINYYKQISENEIIKAINLQSIDESNFDYLIPKFFALNTLNMIVSDSGMGKSSLIGDLILTFFSNKTFLNEKNNYPDSSILYISGDENLGTVKRRLLRLGLDCDYEDVKERLALIENEKITDLPNQIGIIRKQLDKYNGKIKLLVIDSLSSVTSESEINEDHSSFAKHLYKLAGLANDFNLTTVALHHSNKIGGIGGTNRIKAPCNLIIQIKTMGDKKEEENDKRRLIECIKNRNGEKFQIQCNFNYRNLEERNIFEVSPMYANYDRTYYEEILTAFVKNKTTTLTVKECDNIIQLPPEKVDDYFQILAQRKLCKENDKERTLVGDMLNDYYKEIGSEEMAVEITENDDVIENYTEIDPTVFNTPTPEETAPEESLSHDTHRVDETTQDDIESPFENYIVDGKPLYYWMALNKSGKSVAEYLTTSEEYKSVVMLLNAVSESNLLLFNNSVYCKQLKRNLKELIRLFNYIDLVECLENDISDNVYEKVFIVLEEIKQEIKIDYKDLESEVE